MVSFKWHIIYCQLFITYVDSATLLFINQKFKSMLYNVQFIASHSVTTMHVVLPTVETLETFSSHYLYLYFYLWHNCNNECTILSMHMFTGTCPSPVYKCFSGDRHVPVNMKWCIQYYNDATSTSTSISTCSDC